MVTLEQHRHQIPAVPVIAGQGAGLTELHLLHPLGFPFELLLREGLLEVTQLYLLLEAYWLVPGRGSHGAKGRECRVFSVVLINAHS